MALYDWSHTINRALWLYTQRAGITYCLGCSGEVAGRDKHVENNFRYYYEHGWDEHIGFSIPGWEVGMSTDKTWDMWLKLHKGKMCFDCSGFIDWCIGYEGIHKYTSWDFGEMKKQDSLSSGFAGSVLWKKGHVGLDIGYGACIDIGHYGGTLEISMLGDKDWTSSHLIENVNYEGANAR